ncbi:MAG TPA: radical SAM protein [Gemmataceae bacterium]|nr:radical SAM protein [Gemmataceae bacterium]
MKLLLIQPKLPESFWSFSWAFREIARDKRAAISPLGLATVAALTPPAWDVTIADENVEPIDWNAPADVVGVCGMAVQYPRQCEIAERFRARGCHVVVGGSYASLCPEEYADIADTVVAGEAEYVWPRFCADFEKGCPGELYRETQSVDLAESPVPRHDLLNLHRYQSVAVQFSRGCPFRCEFCDIIVTFGRKPRAKSISQVERELDLLRAHGVRNVFFIDDNLIGHLPRCRELLAFLQDYQARHRYRFTFGAETSANVAAAPGLLPALRRANFQWVFIGLETPSREALLETRKEQNTRADALETVRAVYSHGIDVYGSFVVGFDADDTSIFDRQFEFIVRSGILVASVALLIALPKTPLFERLQRAGRLRPTAGDRHRLWNNLIATNVVPLRMSEEELIAGFRDLINRLADDPVIAERVRTKLRYLGRRPRPLRLSVWSTTFYLARFVWRGLLPGGPRRWALFARSLGPALRNPRLLPFAVQNWIYGLAIQAFVREHLNATASTSPAQAPSPTNGLVRLS